MGSHGQDLGLAGERFWDGPLAGTADVAERILAQGHTGLTLAAPEFVALDAVSTLPVVLACSADEVELRRLAIRARGVVVAVDLEAGVARARRLLAGETVAPTAPPLGFEGGLARREPRARAVEVFRADLHDHVEWRPGTWHLHVLAMDRRSNTCHVALGASPSTYDPAVAEHARRERARAEPPQVWPTPDPHGGAPRYVSSEGTPQIPDRPAIALAAERVVRLGAGARWILHGSFRTICRPHHIAPNGAVVTVTLVLTGSDDPGPFAVTMRVPSFAVIDPKAPPETVTGVFAVDLLALPGMPRAPQTYAVYAFAAEATGGPALTALA
jgi:hypothetical protein